MEGTSEVNDTLDNSAAAPKVKTKENDESPIPENCNPMETPALSGSLDNRWFCRSRGKKANNPRIKKSVTHQNYEAYVDLGMRSPKCPSDNLENDNITRHIGSQSQSEHLERNLCPNDDSDIVAELTVSNYKSSRVSVDGCSNSRDDGTKKKDWKVLYVASGDSRDALSKEDPDVGSEGASNLCINPFKHQRLRQKDYSRVFELSVDAERTFTSEKLFASGCIRNKALEGYGLPEFIVRDLLKGKRIASKHLGSHDAPQTPVQTSRREIHQRHLDEAPDLVTNSGDLNQQGDGHDSNSDYHRGMSLREWFTNGLHNSEKPERFLIFREILELVDTYHSQGLALKNLSPSFLVLKSPIQVKYVGPFISQSSNIDRDSFYPPNQFKRKINLEVDNQIPENVSVKQQKISENRESFSQLHVFGNRARMDDSARMKVQDLNCKFWPQYLAGGEQKIRSVTSKQDVSRYNIQQPACNIFQLEEMWYTSPEQMNGGTCSFSSNVYSLGVLLFEFFCLFKSWNMRAAAMVNLRHRILPPSFLSESPKEAGFCLWLLHPEPSLRPNSRDILVCEFMCETQDHTSVDRVLASINDEYAESEMLLHFLLFAKEQKEKRATQLKEELRCLTTDIIEVERRNLSRMELSVHARSPPTYKSLTESYPFEPGSNHARIARNIGQLERAYFSTRSKISMPATNSVSHNDKNVLQMDEKFHPTSIRETDRLGAFFDGLCKYARYNKFEVLGTVRNSDILNSTNVVCSLSFDRDEEYLATAGISKRIKIFDFSALLNDNVDIHYPVVEMLSKSRLSCVSWNNYIKNYLASTDYDGTVQIWDASTGQSFIKFTDHQKRAWSVDFSLGEPTKLASGSDDCSVKLWSIKERNCTSSIRTLANVCCVQFSPSSSNLLSFGSADYKTYCYDLRNTKIPWCTLAAHRKAVSYVKFVDSQTLVSASTDNTLKLWDLEKVNSSGLTTESSLTLRGHTNEKNFVGLSVFDGYIACGSETNEVYAYYKSFPMPITSHKFGSIDPITALEVNEETGQFVSSVCWREKSNTVVAANSTGYLKLLKMV